MFNWTIETCEHEVATGGITVAHWRCNAVDGDYSASTYGSCGFIPDPTSESFKPYNQVSQDDVLGWVWGQLDKAEIETNLVKAINMQKAPATLAGTPWA